jgi:NADPH:quinone reductase-like Zn-dependent oxidoreductase
VQLGKILGCRIIGVVGRTHKVQVAKDLGADAVIDKSTEDLWARAKALAPEGYDVILDANGVATLKDSYAHLKRPGKLVVYGFSSMMPKGGRTNWLKLISGVLRTPRFSPLKMTTHSHSVLAFNLSYLFDQAPLLMAAMQDIFGWLEAGKIQAPPVQTFALDAVAEAHQAIESGNTVGKLVLVP